MIRDPEVSAKPSKDDSPREGRTRWGNWNTQGAAQVKYTGRWFQLHASEDSNDWNHLQLVRSTPICGELPVTGSMQAQAGELQPASCRGRRIQTVDGESDIAHFQGHFQLRACHIAGTRKYLSNKHGMMELLSQGPSSSQARTTI